MSHFKEGDRVRIADGGKHDQERGTIINRYHGYEKYDIRLDNGEFVSHISWKSLAKTSIPAPDRLAPPKRKRLLLCK